MKKILLFILILIVSYILAVFLVPETTDRVSSNIGFDGINQHIRDIHDGVNSKASNISSGEEFGENINNVLKEAESISKTVITGVKDTKETIDEIRATLSGAEDTFNRTKEVIQETGENIIDIKDGLNNLGEIGSGISKVIDSDKEK